MHFNRHFELEGRHAYLSASKYHWVHYSDDKFDRVFAQTLAAARGDRLHKLAHDLIRERVKLPRNNKTLSLYVNDVIGFQLSPEQPLAYSENFFGTADAVGFRNNTLRIFDLKTGINPCKVTQLEVYAALFCLEYDMAPHDITIELRMYQNDGIEIYQGDPDVIYKIMEKGKEFDTRIRLMKEEALS